MGRLAALEAPADPARHAPVAPTKGETPKGFISVGATLWGVE